MQKNNPFSTNLCSWKSCPTLLSWKILVLKSSCTKGWFVSKNRSFQGVLLHSNLFCLLDETTCASTCQQSNLPLWKQFVNFKSNISYCLNKFNHPSHKTQTFILDKHESKVTHFTLAQEWCRSIRQCFDHYKYNFYPISFIFLVFFLLQICQKIKQLQFSIHESVWL